MKYGHCQEEHMEQKEIMNEKRDEFLEVFLKKYPGCSCRELLGYDISVPEEMQKILDEGLLFDFCPQVVADIMEILDDIFKDSAGTGRNVDCGNCLFSVLKKFLAKEKGKPLKRPQKGTEVR